MITVERVTQTFETPAGEFTAVRDVSFRVSAGRFVSLVGPSGCGKTTLLGMIAGLLPVSAGRIVLGDRPVSGGVPPDIGYLFQRDALLPWKTALQNVALPLTIRGRPAAEARSDRKSTRLNSSHSQISYAVFCLKKKKNHHIETSTSITRALFR